MRKTKFICIISLMLALLTLLTSCNAADSPTSVTTDGAKEITTDATEPEAPTGPLELVKDHKSEYVIVYGESSSSDAKSCATLLSNKLRAIAGVSVGTSADSTEASDKEIVVGVTNREGCNDTASLGKNGWSVSALGDRVVILGGSDAALRYAVTYFIYQYVKDGDILLDRTLNYVHKAEDTVMRLSKNADKVKAYGRHSVTSSGITADWSASGIEFNAECCGDISITVSSTKKTYFAAYVNGERVDELFLANEGSTTFKVAEGLDYGAYNIRLLKCANVVQANCIVESVKLDGALLEAPKDNKLLIEFIGDSITCGYGVIDGATSDSANVGTYKYCDATSAFPYLTAEKLGADWRIEGVSGAGMCKGYTTYTVPEIFYTHTWTRNKTKQYDFASERTPDVIVINLGTNDQSKSSDPEAFKTAVKTFVTTIREKYGKDVPIVWAYGMMNDTMSTHVKAAFTALGGEASGYYTVKLTQNKKGGNGHPNAEGQIKAAEELTKYLKENVLK